MSVLKPNQDHHKHSLVHQTQERSPGKPTQKPDFGKRIRQQVAKEYGTTVSQQGGRVIRTNPKQQRNSYEPEGNSLMENNNLKTKHNEKITNNSKIKSPKEFFKQADVKPIYPDNPPPKLIKGRHPDFYDDTKMQKDLPS